MQRSSGTNLTGDGTLTTSADNRPCTSSASVYVCFLQQQKPIQFMQRVTICQDSTHLPLEPYVSHKIFEQIFYSSSTTTTSFTAFPASKSTDQAIRVKCLEESRYSSRLTPW